MPEEIDPAPLSDPLPPPPAELTSAELAAELSKRMDALPQVVASLVLAQLARALREGAWGMLHPSEQNELKGKGTALDPGNADARRVLLAIGSRLRNVARPDGAADRSEDTAHFQISASGEWDIAARLSPAHRARIWAGIKVGWGAVKVAFTLAVAWWVASAWPTIQAAISHHGKNG